MICLTKSQAKYLKAVYQIEGEVTVTKLANRLNFSKPSVVRGLKSLAKQGLVNYDPKIILTDKGMKLAENMVNTENIIALFLEEILKIDRKTAVVDANNIKHAVSCHTVKKLEAFLYQELKDQKIIKPIQDCQINQQLNCYKMD